MAIKIGVKLLGERILVVDDERPIAEILKFNLEKEGFEVSLAFDGTEAVEKAFSEKPDLVILDVMLPRLNGLEVCELLRKESAVPILMLTAKGEEEDKISGFELGADDYVTKPFSLRELIARVKALLRRTQSSSQENGSDEPSDARGSPYGRFESTQVIRLGELVIDLGAYEVTKAGRRVDLTPREFELLRYLATKPGEVFTRKRLLQEVWGYEFYGDTKTVDVTVRRLREKVECDPSDPAYIQTKRGVGYYFKKY